LWSKNPSTGTELEEVVNVKTRYPDWNRVRRFLRRVKIQRTIRERAKHKFLRRIK